VETADALASASTDIDGSGDDSIAGTDVDDGRFVDLSRHECSYELRATRLDNDDATRHDPHPLRGQLRVSA
jgi:hypothetical protein